MVAMDSDPSQPLHIQWANILWNEFDLNLKLIDLPLQPRHSSRTMFIPLILF